MQRVVKLVPLLLVTVGAVPYHLIHIEDSNYWNQVGEIELKLALQQKYYYGKAKNVIFFVGDGMGPTTVTAARIYAGQTKNDKGESNAFSFERFSSVGLSKTYNVDKQVADSASTATAMFSGVKIRHNMVGLDMNAHYNVCVPENNQKAMLTSMMTWAQDAGKFTGIVTTTRVTHATPAATYAHTNNRDWECDSEVPKQFTTCVKDIAKQLVEDAPGNKFKVILGGGTKQFGVPTEKSADDSCSRNDSRNLVVEWQQAHSNSKFVRNRKELETVNTKTADYLFGLFAPGHMSFVGEEVITRPSLPLMTSKAIEMLSKGKEGYVLLVEGGRIDQAHHKNYAKLAMMETVEFDEAIETALDMTNPEDTLIIVTADHSHPLSINGYPERGNDILGLAKNENKSFYETLTYTNGPGYMFHHTNMSMGNCIGNCSEIEQRSASVRDVRNIFARATDPHYQNFAAFYLEDDTHGGEDVAIYAQGPMAHLLIGVHEQNYIAHVVSYAACIGPQASKCKSRKFSNSGKIEKPDIFLTICLIILSSLSVLTAS